MEAGTQPACVVSARRGVGIDPVVEQMPLSEFRHRTDEFRISNPLSGTLHGNGSLVLSFFVVTPKADLSANLVHTPFSSATVEIQGVREALVERVKRQVKKEGEGLVASSDDGAEKNSKPPVHREPLRPVRMPKGIGTGLAAFFNSKLVEVIGGTVVGGLIVGYLIYRFHWAP